MIRVTTEEEHYTIKRVAKIPKVGNANWLYAIKGSSIEEFHRWNALSRKYEIVKVGATVLPQNTITTINTDIGIVYSDAPDNAISIKGANGVSVSAVGKDIIITGATADYSLYATINSPALTGIPTAPTATPGTNTGQIATTAFVSVADSGNVKLTGNQNIAGSKTVNNTLANSSRFNFVNQIDATSEVLYAISLSPTYPALRLSNQSSTSLLVSGSGVNSTGIKVELIQNNPTANKMLVLSNKKALNGAVDISTPLTVLRDGVEVAKISDLGAITGSSVIVNSGTVRLKNYTVATLPVGVSGDMAYVTDAIAPTYLGTLTGGGTAVCPVFYNGTAWVSH